MFDRLIRYAVRCYLECPGVGPVILIMYGNGSLRAVSGATILSGAAAATAAAAILRTKGLLVVVTTPLALSVAGTILQYRGWQLQGRWSCARCT
jgi:hypothetical protein